MISRTSAPLSRCSWPFDHQDIVIPRRSLLLSLAVSAVSFFIASANAARPPSFISAEVLPRNTARLPSLGIGLIRPSGRRRREDRYEIVYTAVDKKPEWPDILLKRLVGERGFEPPTPWSRTRCSTRLSHSPTVSSLHSTTPT